MRKKNRRNSGESFLDKDVSIEGLLEFQQRMRIDGRVKGQVRSREGTLVVGEQAVMEGDIHVAVALVRGRVNGTLTASTRVEMEAPAVMEGDICSPAVSIAKGVEFNGKCIMDGKPEVSEERQEEA